MYTYLRLSNAGFLVRDSPGLWCKPVQAARGLARAARSPGRPVAELLCAPPLCCCCGSPPTEPRFEMHSRLRSERNAKRLIELRTLICAASWQQQQLSERAQHGCRASPRGPPPPRTLRHQPLEPGSSWMKYQARQKGRRCEHHDDERGGWMVSTWCCKHDRLWFWVRLSEPFSCLSVSSTCSPS